MPVKLIAPLIKTFTLEATDKKYSNDGDPTTVTVRQARKKQDIERQAYFDTMRREWDSAEPDKVALVTNIGLQALMQLEVWLTLCECNLLNVDGSVLFPSKQEDNEPVLAMKRSEFDKAWGALPGDIADEIHAKVLEVNPVWRGLSGEG